MYICGLPPRSETNAISFPCGAQDGDTSSPQLSVNLVRPLPSLFIAYMSAFPSLLITRASFFPSGDHEAPRDVPSGTESLASLSFPISLIYTEGLPPLKET